MQIRPTRKFLTELPWPQNFYLAIRCIFVLTLDSVNLTSRKHRGVELEPKNLLRRFGSPGPENSFEDMKLWDRVEHVGAHLFVKSHQIIRFGWTRRSKLRKMSILGLLGSFFQVFSSYCCCFEAQHINIYIS